ncbi:hypothetical protein N8I77_007996 [Diaporthe amygdali]|uniref:Uncharacterized protein n=1 Tax=Phomopsis amygdali TaxID=1214568 RepID=A0AAD9SCE0_PHOAM|nr:hypothetical protein N8I77_007996 [Diaporthe amygdali]
MDSSTIKETVMRQVQLESNTSNARMLIEAENERDLFREVPPKAWIICFERRASMLHIVHGGEANFQITSSSTYPALADCFTLFSTY